jgi:hypothetical protein
MLFYSRKSYSESSNKKPRSTECVWAIVILPLPWILPVFTLNWISSNRQPSVKLAPKGKMKARISEEGVGDSYGLRTQAHKTSACVDRQSLQTHIAVQWLPTRLSNNVLGSNLGFGYSDGKRFLWYCAISNGGHGHFETIFFFHVQNLSSSKRVN